MPASYCIYGSFWGILGRWGHLSLYTGNSPALTMGLLEYPLAICQWRLEQPCVGLPSLNWSIGSYGGSYSRVPPLIQTQSSPCPVLPPPRKAWGPLCNPSLRDDQPTSLNQSLQIGRGSSTDFCLPQRVHQNLHFCPLGHTKSVRSDPKKDFKRPPKKKTTNPKENSLGNFSFCNKLPGIPCPSPIIKS